jgi:hypothetical protein
VKDKLDIWPPLPLLIQGPISPISPSVLDNILAVLNRHHRVSVIHFNINCFHITPDVEKVWAAMQVPFPELTDLRLWSNDPGAPIVPDSFLGGSSPRLQEIRLTGIPFPGLPKLLLSATHLVYLSLKNIGLSGYISPETIVTCLSPLASLKSLHLRFLLPFLPDGESRHPSSATRSILPALSDIHFEGSGEYLEDLLACIDAPQLNALFIYIINETDLDTFDVPVAVVPQLAQFISRTPMFKSLDEARVSLCGDVVLLTLLSPTPGFEDLKI